MCDFFSGIFRVVGGRVEFYHDETNSHSGMIEYRRWRVNTPEREYVWEYEWDPFGNALPALRGDPPPKVRSAADRLTEKLRRQVRSGLSEWVDVRRKVAENVNTLPDVLVALSKDEDAGVRYRVARHEKTPPAVLEYLSEDEKADVRWWVAQHRNTPLEVLAVLSQDEKDEVRWSVSARGLIE